MKNKKNNKTGFFIFLGLIIVIILTIVLLLKQSNKEQSNTIINEVTIEKAKDTSIKGYEITNIEFEEENGQTIVTADVTNITDKNQDATDINVVLYDSNKKVIEKIPTVIGETEQGERIQLNVRITGTYGNIKEVKIEER